MRKIRKTKVNIISAIQSWKVGNGKWENRDINIAEWTNIPKFSNLDDIVTPIRLLDTFFHNVLVDMIVGYTKLYSHREKTGISFGITNKKLRFLLSVILLSRCYELPDHKMYWKTTFNTFLSNA